MGDYTIQARLDAACEPGDVSMWLQSPEGIAGWWSDRVSGSASTAGDVFAVDFPSTDVTFRLVVVECTDNVVEWDVPESPPWWKGTTIRFDVEATDDGSTISFTHRGFESDDPIISVITPAWVGFLNNLVEVAQTGLANPAVVN